MFKSLVLHMKFQSLLCWIMVCKGKGTPTGNARSRSFNPCYVGLWSVRKVEQDFLFKSLLFQSLLCWIMVCKSQVFTLVKKALPVSILVMLDYGL